MFEPPGQCPVCGRDVQAGAKACPDCGADERSGWQELDFPPDAFDYKEFLAEEFGQERGKRELHPIWLIAALLLVLAMVGATLFSFFHSTFFR